MTDGRQDNELQKLVVDLPENDQATAETIWTAVLGENCFQIKNVPIWAYGLAFEDIVAGRAEADGRIHFTEVLKRSGLLTVRIAGPDAPDSLFRRLVDALAARSLAAEHYTNTYSAFAMTRDEFGKVSQTITNAEDTGLIFVEVANDDRDDD